MRLAPFCFLLLIIFTAVVPGDFQPGSPQEPPADTELRKLDAMLNLVRARTARDYAVDGTNSIGEGKYVEVGGIDQWGDRLVKQASALQAASLGGAS